MTRQVFCLLALALATVRPCVAADETRITNASNVRLRSAPGSDASIVGELPLGTELVVVGSLGGPQPWYHVRTGDGHDGWVFGALTTALDPGRRDQIIESVVEARLRVGGDFSATVQLVDFIERTGARLNDREARGRFGLYRLRSLSAVLRNIPSSVRDREIEANRQDAEPYGSWIRGHLDAARYNEGGEAWIVDREYAKTLHDIHQGTAAADEIAWFYVNDGELGECEGNVPCYVAEVYGRNGWYLTEHPRGRHVDESTAKIAGVLDGAMDNLRLVPAVLAAFDPKTRCGELHAWLDPLTAAVTASISMRKEEAFAAIDRYAQLCK